MKKDIILCTFRQGLRMQSKHLQQNAQHWEHGLIWIHAVLTTWSLCLLTLLYWLFRTLPQMGSTWYFNFAINGFHKKKRSWHSYREDLCCAPNSHTRFYIRMLLLHIKGATSFTDLCSYNSVTYQSNKGVAFTCALFEDNTEWYKC